MTRWIFPASLVAAIFVGEYVRYRLTKCAAKIDRLLAEYDPDRHILPVSLTPRPAAGADRDGSRLAGEGAAAPSPADPSHITPTENQP